MDVRLTRHAREQMARRRITVSELTEALDRVEATYPSRSSPWRRVVLGRSAAGRRLKIVVLPGRPDVVVTVADRDADV